MAGFKRFQDIVGWQLSHALKLRVDEFIARPRGFTHKEFAQLLRVARGSLGEMLNHLLDAREQQLISEDELIETSQLARRAIGATTGLIRYLQSTPDPPPPRYKKRPERWVDDES